MSGNDARKLKKRIAAIKQRKAQRAMDPFSTTVRDFCRPLIAVESELSGPENAVSLGIFAWNAAFLPEERWRANFRKSIASFGLDEEARDALEGIIEEMVRQKGLLFPDDRRVVTSFDVRVSDGEVFVDARSALASKTLLPHMRDLDVPQSPADVPSGCPSGCGTPGDSAGCPDGCAGCHETVSAIRSDGQDTAAPSAFEGPEPSSDTVKS